jgi:hypothetical protein
MMMISPLLSWLQGALALLLGIQAIVVASLILWLDGTRVEVGRFRLVHVVDREQSWRMGLDTRWIVLACLALSACLQALGLVLYEGRWRRALRWIETGVCMPTATMAVAVEAGVRDVYAIEAAFGLAWCGQALSMCAWRHSDALPQYAGWCALLMAYGPILDALATNHTSRDEGAVVLVVGEFGLAVLTFGVYTYERLRRAPILVVYANELKQRGHTFSIQEEEEDEATLIVLPPSPPPAHGPEQALVLLGFLAHTLLCWSVLGPVLATSS